MFPDIHRALVNTMRVLPWADSMQCASASSDGTVKIWDIETGLACGLLDLNPQGWVNEKTWQMVYGCDVNNHLQLVSPGMHMRTGFRQ